MNSQGKPVGLTRLGNYTFSNILAKQLIEKELIKESVQVDGVSVDYYIDPINKIIITTPVLAVEKTGESQLTTAIKMEAALNKLERYAQHRLIMPVIQAGLLEDHIVTVCKNALADDKHFVINSKGQTTVKLLKNDEVIELGTQSVFDRYTCGYHTLMNISICYDLFCNKQKDSTSITYPKMSSEELDIHIRKKSSFINPVQFGISLHKTAKNLELSDLQTILPVPDLSLSGRLYSAYHSTYYTDPYSKERTRWILNPFNLPELIVRGVQETFGWAADYIHANVNRSSGLRQMFWSGVSLLLHGVQALCHIVATGLNKIATKPFEKYQSAHRNSTVSTGSLVITDPLQEGLIASRHSTASMVHERLTRGDSVPARLSVSGSHPKEKKAVSPSFVKPASLDEQKGQTQYDAEEWGRNINTPNKLS